MSRTSTATSQARRQSPRVQPQKSDEARGDHLKVVRESAGQISAASLGVVTFAVIFAGLLGAVLFHSVVVGGQLELDELQSQLADERTLATELRVAVAQLEAPERVLQEAARLGMVFPVGEAYINGFPLGVQPLLPPGGDPFSLEGFDPTVVAPVSAEELEEVER